MLDKQEVMITAVICIIGVVTAYILFGKSNTTNEKNTPKKSNDSLPTLSKEIPSYIGPSHWKLTTAHKPYKTTKIFNKDTVPRGLTSRHNTKKEVTGLIHVVEGELKVTVFANKKDIKTDQILIVKKGQCAISAPQAWHKVAANTDDMKFYVEFWKIPDTN
eukprot:121999_1